MVQAPCEKVALFDALGQRSTVGMYECSAREKLTRCSIACYRAINFVLVVIILTASHHRIIRRLTPSVYDGPVTTFRVCSNCQRAAVLIEICIL